MMEHDIPWYYLNILEHIRTLYYNMSASAMRSIYEKRHAWQVQFVVFCAMTSPEFFCGKKTAQAVIWRYSMWFEDQSIFVSSQTYIYII